MRTITRRTAAILVAAVAAATLVVTPAAHAEILTTESCPEGYKGMIVGYNHPKLGTREVFVCTNLV